MEQERRNRGYGYAGNRGRGLISFQSAAGWLPAFILPVSTFIQFYRILKNRSAKNVSATAWSLFGVANIGAYIFTGRYDSVQSILAFLVSAFLDVLIVFAVYYFHRAEKHGTGESHGGY